MRWDDPNRPEPLEPLRPETRDLEAEGPADAAHAGYERIARRPRIRNSYDIVPEERADRIEEMFSPLPGMLDFD